MAASDRIRDFVDALPLRPGMHVLEIGCGPGVAARMVAERVALGQVLAIDRSARSIQIARRSPRPTSLRFQQAAIEDFEPGDDSPLFDVAFAMRVGVLDGRHPAQMDQALRNIARALKPVGRLFIDGGTPLREIDLSAYRS